jgi:hypothetical protein
MVGESELGKTVLGRKKVIRLPEDVINCLGLQAGDVIIYTKSRKGVFMKRMKV